MREPLAIGTHKVLAGTRRTIDLPISVLSNYTPMTLPVHVIHGRRDGPTIFVSAAVHGDEIIGVEIIRRLLRSRQMRSLRGTLLAIPIVNGFGFINHSRYLPDRRDLNRSFPGSGGGSLAAQLAHLFMTEVVLRCQVGIDLHSAALHRTNLPQIRIAETNGRLRELADAFGAPLIITGDLREGSLRHAAGEAGVDVMVYEAGEALRFDEFAIRVGFTGVLRVMRALDMISSRRVPDHSLKSRVSTSSHWLRAPAGGLLKARRAVGVSVSPDEVIGTITDPFGENEYEIKARSAGLIVGRTNLPVVNQGDALFHIARVAAPDAAERHVGRLEEALQGEPLFDEDEII